MSEAEKTFSIQLKEATWPIHQKVDKMVFGRLVSSEEAISISFAKWHARLLKTGLIDSNPLRSLIDMDFDHLQSLLPAAAAVEQTYENEYSEHQLLGIFYVVRGSANGSKFIIKKLPQHHSLWAYFDYMASLSQENWNQLKARLDEIEEEKQHEVIQSASLAFNWLQEEIETISEATKAPTDINQ
jgi:heme oxygenase